MPDRIRNKPFHYDRLKELMKVLREECPWDRTQTLATLRRFTIEETHELLEAIEDADLRDDWTALKSELGDLLLHIAFYSRLAEEQQHFSLDDVIDALVEKMIYRHPHVFSGAEHSHKHWEELKANENEHKERHSLMDGIPAMPALSRARKLQQRAARIGFDWPDAKDVLEKLQEEIEELQEACNANDPVCMEEELGDVLFTLVNWARKVNIDAELALMATNRKFSRRFRLLEQLIERDNKTVEDMDLIVLEAYYQQAKNMLNTMEDSYGNDG